MSVASLAQILTSVQFTTVGGRRLAVLSAEDWESLIEWLEDYEDKQIIQAAHEHLLAGPEKSGAIPLEDALREL